MLTTDRVRAIFWGTNRIVSTARRGPGGAPLYAKCQEGGLQISTRNIAVILAGILFPMFALAFNANAVQLISDGGFETGLTGWAVTSSVGSGGSWFPDITTSTPLTGNPTVGAFSGTGYAVTDQFGAGVNALSQNYTVPVGTTSLTLTFDMFINDWGAPPDNMSVLILGAGGNPVTGAGTTLISTDTLVTGGVPNPYIAYNFAISGFVAGNTYILDFREADSVANMNVGLDNVSLDAVVGVVSTPEPGGVVLLLVALGAMGALGRRRLRAIPRLGTLLYVLTALALLSQPVRAQNQNVAYPVVSPDSVQPGEMRPYAWIMSILDPAATIHGPGQTNCGAGQNTCYYFPVDVNTAYTVPFISNGNGGAGMTVAVTDAYFNSQTESDLVTFNADFGLPACTIANGCLTIVGQTCGAPPAQPNPITTVIRGWFQETDLDLQWVHSIAPKAKILLVAANSSSGADLYAAVQCAKANADVVTNSWGGGEFATEATFDPQFSSQVPILFSSGDTFAMTQYPCVSPNVTCVGGTHLLETATSYRNIESVWDEPATTPPSGTGGGCSLFESEPPFQVGFSTCGSRRGVPDIAAIADSFTGVLVYLGTNAGGPGLFVFGGTSLASPVMAGVVANIDASRVAAGKSILGGSLTSLYLTSSIYGAAGSSYHYRFYDVTTGTDAAPGWDDRTGLGVTLNPALTAYLKSLP